MPGNYQAPSMNKTRREVLVLSHVHDKYLSHRDCCEIGSADLTRFQQEHRYTLKNPIEEAI